MVVVVVEALWEETLRTHELVVVVAAFQGRDAQNTRIYIVPMIITVHREKKQRRE